MADTKLDPTKSYGWTGRILRVNLTDGDHHHRAHRALQGLPAAAWAWPTRSCTTRWPPGTDPFAPENKVVFAVGPLTASGVPLAGRTTICSLSTYTKDNQIVDAHCGGMLGAAHQEGRLRRGHPGRRLSDTPVYLKIEDDDVQIKPADDRVGPGHPRHHRSAAPACEGTDSCVATIGPAGENLLPYACLINSRNHSAGAGLGAVMGSKKVKALVVTRYDSPSTWPTPRRWPTCPTTCCGEIVGLQQQPRGALHPAGMGRVLRRRHRAGPPANGLYWALAEGGPIDTGEPKPGEINTVGYRCMKSTEGRRTRWPPSSTPSR